MYKSLSDSHLSFALRELVLASERTSVSLNTFVLAKDKEGHWVIQIKVVSYNCTVIIGIRSNDLSGILLPIMKSQRQTIKINQINLNLLARTRSFCVDI